jgi:ribosomal-protein-alanine N-acetyltransferase
MIFLRSGNVDDIPAMRQLESTAASSAHWREAEYLRIFDPQAAQRMALVAAEDAIKNAPQDAVEYAIKGAIEDVVEAAPSGTLIGFLVARTSGPEWELENIVVAASGRRRGIGRSLVAELLRCACQSGAEGVILEVRASNLPAIALYESLGFKACRRRSAYYSHPEEDAILYLNPLRLESPETR